MGGQEGNLAAKSTRVGQCQGDHRSVQEAGAAQDEDHSASDSSHVRLYGRGTGLVKRPFGELGSTWRGANGPCFEIKQTSDRHICCWVGSARMTALVPPQSGAS